MESRRLWGLLALAGPVVTAMLALVGQYDPDPQLSAMTLAVSDFAEADRGGATEAAMVAFSGTAVALVMATAGRLPRAVTVLLGLFSFAMLVAAIAPTDPTVATGGPLTVTAQVHRYASVVAFLALPAAGAVLARRAREQLGRAATWVAGLSTATGAALVAVFASSAFADRALFGLVERVALVLALALLAVLCGALIRPASVVMPGTR